MRTGDAPGATPRRRPVSALFCETVAAFLVLLWRVWVLPFGILWRDTVAILALFWLFIRFAAGTKIARPATLLIMLGLLVLYVWGRAPLTLAAVRIAP